MPIYKRCAYCGRRIRVGEECGCVSIKRDHSYYDKHKRNKESAAIYHGRKWDKSRQAALDLDQGIDVYMYQTTGEVIPADTVHHIEPLVEKPDLAYDIDNLISLSDGTHSRIEAMYRSGDPEIRDCLREMIRKGRGESKSF